MPATPACVRFHEHADELALGGPDGRLRHELLEHAAACTSCQTHLTELSLVTDRLLLLAPDMEPPPGFEGRVLDRLATARGDGPDALRQRRRAHRVRLLAAAAVLVVAALAGLAVGRVSARRTPDVRAVRSGQITRLADGSVAGTIRLVDLPRPMALVTIDSPRPFGGSVTCALVGPDWTSVTVGSWTYDGVEHGAWAVGIDPALLKSVRMNVLDANGSVVATATLTGTAD